jgi:hypothetical protein
MRPILALGIALAAAIPATGAESRGIRLFLTAGAGLPGGTSAYVFQYNPHPEYVPEGSYAGQTLTVDPGAGWDLGAGLIVPLGGVVGLRLSFSWSASPLGGENGPYEMLFKYTNWYYPFWDGVEMTRTESTDWFPTYGTLRQAAAGLDLDIRVPAGRVLELGLTAGPRLVFASGRMGGLGYTQYMGSSHGALFFRDYIMTLDLPVQARLGWSAGLEAGVRLSPSLRLFLRGSFQASGAYERAPQIRTADIYMGMTPAAMEDLKAIREALELPVLTMPQRRFSSAIGLAFTL